MAQQVDLYQPIMSARVGAPPLVLRVGVTSNVSMMEGGVPQSTVHGEDYVLLSALPPELRERVKIAVQSLISGM